MCTSTTDRQGGKGKVPIGEYLSERGPRYFWLEMVVRRSHSPYDNAGTGPKVTVLVTTVSQITHPRARCRLRPGSLLQRQSNCAARICVASPRAVPRHRRLRAGLIEKDCLPGGDEVLF